MSIGYRKSGHLFRVTAGVTVGFNVAALAGEERFDLSKDWIYIPRPWHVAGVSTVLHIGYQDRRCDAVLVWAR